ncbi:DUF4345 domain-containing protein [Mesorhizobium sp. NBSH29]|uniref:DUF4345 domain-containing protein n=1 Tax=Mesorhizobium sp. NBSH29 TaxID=2654249 RepID=UPI0018964E31|nr:DUF4345 domain-containing protein [Mesorhizobium sp. NBSH29]QPC85816.1 DUF4345 domain-containing protein [Mesorhizobium sp. NBSH29]
MMQEKRALQAIVSVLAAVPVMAGLAGVVMGPAFLKTPQPWPADLDSHFRFLSGVFLAVGVAWYSCVPHIETRTNRVRLLGAITVSGGAARLVSLVLAGAPSAGHIYGLAAELIAVPLLILWQRRIARSA